MAATKSSSARRYERRARPVSVYDAAVLIAGDRDLAEAVSAAQDLGRRIIIAYPQGSGVSAELRQLADDLLVIAESDIRAMLSVRRPSAMATATTGRLSSPV